MLQLPRDALIRRLRRLCGGHAAPAESLERRAVAVRALAALLRSGAAPRSALKSWHLHTPSELASLGRAARRLHLGAPLLTALRGLEDDFGADAGTITSIFAAQAEAGGDAARMLDSLARAMEERAAWARAALAATSGAMLSGRLVAGLPLMFVPLLPAGYRDQLDVLGASMVGLGLALAFAGMRWISALIPRPPRGDDGPAAFADVAACLLRGGTPLRGALEVAAMWSSTEVRSQVQRARRLVVLGMPWPAALTMAAQGATEEALRSLAATLESAETMGVPVAHALEAYAARRRAEVASHFDSRMRKAPVLMVIPLVLCVLPSFAILGLGPLLRGLSLG